MTEQLLHPENLLRVPFKGPEMIEHLSARVGETAQAAIMHIDRPVSVLIRSRNNAGRIDGLFEDIHSQIFSSEIEVVVVDTESSDGTAEMAKARGATVRTIRQEDFNYPRALNMGFEAASHDWVFSLVGQSSLSNRQVLHTATNWSGNAEIAGIAGLPLPDSGATLSERMAQWYMFTKDLKRPAHFPDRGVWGRLSTNCSAVRRSAWEELGGYDERYGAGGEDGAFADVLTARGYKIMVDPTLAVYRSHGLGPVKGIKQLLYWKTLAEPHSFDLTRMQKFRTDLN